MQNPDFFFKRIDMKVEERLFEKRKRTSEMDKGDKRR
jgi:hypothetical protein